MRHNEPRSALALIVGNPCEESVRLPSDCAARFASANRAAPCYHKLSDDEQKYIEWLVEKHQILSDARQMRPNKLKTLLIHPGIRELLELHYADALAASRDTDHVAYYERLLCEWSKDDLDPSPLLTGDDRIQTGYKPGPNFKKLLDDVREAQLDGTIRTTEEAWMLLHRLLAASGKPRP